MVEISSVSNKQFHYPKTRSTLVTIFTSPERRVIIFVI